jgi:sulfite reductase (NADPH) flavoprotein alpha-component
MISDPDQYVSHRGQPQQTLNQVTSMQTSTVPQPQEQQIALSELHLQRLTQAIQGLTREQVNWASGYLAGLSQAQHLPLQQESSAPRVTVLYATHTGNGRGIAEKVAEDARTGGLNARVLSVADFKPRDLSKEQILFLVVSTHGEGDVPESAAEFERYLFGKRAPQLGQLSFSVFALGDSSYDYFCQAGKLFDERFESLGAKRLLDRVDADVSFDKAAQQWGTEIIERTREVLPEPSSNVVNLSGATGKSRINRSNPFQATLLDNRRITTDDAIANIHHIALEIDPQAISYQPGDALGVWSRNELSLVSEIIQSAGLDAEAGVALEGQSFTLAQALIEKLELTLLHPTVVANWAQLSGSDELLSLADDAHKLREYAQDRQLIDLISEYPSQTDAQSLVDALQPLQPRLYSIASSQQVSDDEVHLTVSAVTYEAHGRSHSGTASNHLVHRLQADDVLAVYVAENTHFRLPANPETPIIMIGAGTGIAPYRAFLQQRQVDNASAKNWLVFGNRHFSRDFLYQQDWVSFRKAGLLSKVSLAFSRDATTRAYIQDRLREEGEELYQWLQQGAHIYVCGGLEMEKGVQESLAEVVNTYSGEPEKDTDQIIDNLRSEGRYLRDVY